MNWCHVAWADFRELGRSRLVWLAAAVVTGLCGLGAAIPSLVADGSDPSYTIGVETLFIAFGTVVPFVALGFGHSVVVGARESGTMRFLLGLPNRRLDIILGMALSRIAATVGVAASGGILGLLVVFAVYDSVALGPTLLVVAGLVTIAIVYAVVGIAVSASSGSSTSAVCGAFGVYVVLFFLWNRIPQAVYWLLDGSLPSGDIRPGWFAFLTRLNPGTAVGDLTAARFEWMRNGQYVSTPRTTEMISGDVPFYLSEPAAVAGVLAWIVIPLVFSYWSFRRR